jgi:hypothetical protein
MSMQEMAEVINARMEMETEDIDFFGSESYEDEEVANVRSTRTRPLSLLGQTQWRPGSAIITTVERVVWHGKQVER